MKKLQSISLPIVAATAAALTLGTTSAQDGSRLKEMDKDGDGKLSQSEVPAEAWAKLSKADADGDGAVSMAELMKARGGAGNGGGDRMAKFFQMSDKNQDGRLTEDEVGSERWARVGKLDKNGDGAVTRDEFPKPGAGTPGGGGGGGGGEFFAKADKDGSGSLTEDEVPAEAWARMSKADANADGAVSKEELMAAHKQRAQGGGGKPGGSGEGKKPKRPATES